MELELRETALKGMQLEMQKVIVKRDGCLGIFVGSHRDAPGQL